MSAIASISVRGRMIGAGALALLYGLALVLFRGEPVATGDQGILLSVAARMLHGDQLYSEVIENKDPLVFYTYELALWIGGWRGPFLLDSIWFAVGAVGLGLLLRELRAPTAAVVAGFVLYPLALTSGWYLPGLTMLGALAFVPWIPWAWLSGRHVTAGVLIGVVLYFKLNLAAVAVAPLLAFLLFGAPEGSARPPSSPVPPRGSSRTARRRRDPFSRSTPGSSPTSSRSSTTLTTRTGYSLPRAGSAACGSTSTSCSSTSGPRAVGRTARLARGGGVAGVVARAWTRYLRRPPGGVYRNGVARPGACHARVDGVLVPPPPDGRVLGDAHGRDLRRRPRRAGRAHERRPWGRRCASRRVLVSTKERLGILLPPLGARRRSATAPT